MGSEMCIRDSGVPRCKNDCSGRVRFDSGWTLPAPGGCSDCVPYLASIGRSRLVVPVKVAAKLRVKFGFPQAVGRYISGTWKKASGRKVIARWEGAESGSGRSNRGTACQRLLARSLGTLPPFLVPHVQWSANVTRRHRRRFLHRRVPQSSCTGPSRFRHHVCQTATYNMGIGWN